MFFKISSKKLVSYSSRSNQMFILQFLQQRIPVDSATVCVFMIRGFPSFSRLIFLCFPLRPFFLFFLLFSRLIFCRLVMIFLIFRLHYYVFTYHTSKLQILSKNNSRCCLDNGREKPSKHNCSRLSANSISV